MGVGGGRTPKQMGLQGWGLRAVLGAGNAVLEGFFCPPNIYLVASGLSCSRRAP